MNINRYNYEEYFILYLDNELDGESRREVELFAEQNPDLKAELDTLMQSKLIPDTTISFEDKGSLLRFHNSSISLANHEEWLTAYIDDELPVAEKEDAEKFIAGNPSIQRELNLLQRAKLQPETIVFPNKESLYRKEEKARVIPIRWWRNAAAAVLLLAISGTAIVLVSRDKTGNSNGPVAKLDPKETTSPNAPNNTHQTHQKDSQENNVASSKEATTNDVSGKEVKSPGSPGKNQSDVVKTKQNGNNGEPEDEFVPVKYRGSSEIVIDNPNTDKFGKDGLTAKVNISESNIANQRLTTPDVTPTTTNTYNNSKDGSADDIKFASEKSGGGLRGFLRKVTRNVEMRTNIKATDDDGRLLIAGLAVKMN